MLQSNEITINKNNKTIGLKYFIKIKNIKVRRRKLISFVKLRFN